MRDCLEDCGTAFGDFGRPPVDVVVPVMLSQDKVAPTVQRVAEMESLAKAIDLSFVLMGAGAFSWHSEFSLRSSTLHCSESLMAK